MEISKQVCTFEQASKLRQLGILQYQSQFVFCTEEENGEWEIAWRGSGYAWSDHPGYDGYPFMVDTFTVAELGVMLNVEVSGSPKELQDEINLLLSEYQEISKSEAELRATILVNLIERKHLSASIVNERLSCQ